MNKWILFRWETCSGYGVHSAFWVAKIDVCKMLAKETDFGILAVVFETIIPGSLYVQFFYIILYILKEI